jgi:glycosyltransferase involved in cell wall biosynthesis
MRVIACGSPYGKGGVGQHFAQLVEETRETGRLARYYAPGIREGDEQQAERIALRDFQLLRRYTPIRFSRGWTSHLKGELFDRKVASRLREPHEQFMGFAGKALHSFRRARAVGFGQIEFVATNSHVDNLMRLHRRAARESGIDDGWLNEAQRRKTLREYETADVIYVHSRYVWASFVEGGVPEHKLRRMILTAHQRFQPALRRPDDGVFRIVCIGRMEATKGVPLLLDAFARLPIPSVELTLVGGWSTRAMRRLIQQAMARDPRIRMAPGDPLPVLHRADVLVHPTYEDGFAYAPYEALACGVPVIVTHDTGMKEYVEEGVNGYVVPTGDADALVERLAHVARHPLSFHLSSVSIDS